MINSDLFGIAFCELKNKYLMPLISTNVPINKAEHWVMKKRLIDYPGIPENIGKKYFSLRMSKQDFYKILISEINLFETKTIELSNDCKLNLTNNWKFITKYYSMYFSALQFLLFQHKGLSHLEKDVTDCIHSLFSSYGRNPDGYEIKSGDYYFTEEMIDDNDVIIKFALKDNSGGSHAHLWEIIYSQLKEIEKNAKSNEKYIYNQLLAICNKETSCFPSETRNHFNYHPESGLNDFFGNKKIKFIPNITKKTLQRFIELDLTENDDFYKKAEYTQYYSIIICSLKEKLYREYISRGNEEDEFYGKNGNLEDLIIK